MTLFDTLDQLRQQARTTAEYTAISKCMDAVQDATGGDLISRQAAIDAIMGEPTDAHYPSWYAEKIEQLPSAQPERKTGRWIFPYGDRKYKRCSACGRTYYSIPSNSNYCPNCGAKMEVEHD